MDHITERACYINAKKSPERSESKMEGDQSVSPVLNRSKKFYNRSNKRDSRVSLEKKRHMSTSAAEEITMDNANQSPRITTKIEIAQMVTETQANDTNNLSKFKSDIMSKIYDGFKTATGKNLSVSESKLRHQATKIFGEILNTNTNAPIDQNLVNKSDSAVKRSFLRKTRVATNTSSTAEGKSASGDRAPVSTDQEQFYSINIKTVANNDTLCPEELAKCFENDIFSQLSPKGEVKTSRATEVYSNCNYNEQTTDTESVDSKTNRSSVRTNFVYNEISESELVYLADTADYLTSHNTSKKPVEVQEDIRNDIEVKEMEKELKKVRKSPRIYAPSKAHTKRLKLKQCLSKNVVDLSVNPSILDNHNPTLSKNLYELHRNTKFTNESDAQVTDRNKSADDSILCNLMKMFGVKSIGFSQEELGISREVFDRHSKVLEAVVNSMRAEEQMQQNKIKHKKVKKHKKESSHRDKDSVKRKMEDRNSASPEDLVKEDSKRSKTVEKIEEEQSGFNTAAGNSIKVTEKAFERAKRLFDSVPIVEPIKELSKIESEDITNDNANTCYTNKKLQIQIGTNNIKININSSSLHEPQIGFRSASGRDINITPLDLEAAKTMYRQVEKEVIDLPKAIEIIPKQILETVQESDSEQTVYKDFCGLECAQSDTDSISTINNYVKQTIHDNNLSEGDAKDLVKFKAAADSVVLGFSSASGNKIYVSEKSLKRAQTLYQEAVENDKEIKFDMLGSPGRNTEQKVAVMFSFATAAGKSIGVIEDNLNKAKKMFDDLENEDILDSNLDGIDSEMFKPLRTIESVNKDYQNINDELLNFEDCNFAASFLTAGGSNIKVSESKLRIASKMFDNIDEDVSDTSLKSAQELIGDAVSSVNNAINKLTVKPHYVRPSSSKKRLGMTSAKCKPITITKQSMDKAKSLFDDTEDLRDIDPDLGTQPLRNTSPERHVKDASPTRIRTAMRMNISVENSRNTSPLRSSFTTTSTPNNSRLLDHNLESKLPRLCSPSRQINTSKNGISPTLAHPIRLLNFSACNSRNSSPMRHTSSKLTNVSTPVKEAQNSSFHNLTITPIKALPRHKITNQNLSTIQESPSVLYMQQSSSDVSQIKADFDEECEILQKKLDMIHQRKSALDLQESIMTASAEDYRKPKPGILYLLKQRPNRVPLKDLQLCAAENLEYFKVEDSILQLNFSIAEQVHFNAAVNPNGISATIKTKDGGVIVPNVNDSIGSTEIIRGFQTMPGIDPDLIPKGWIENHFNMIVWKLASYERIFPHYFKNSLCLENVVQQLKYRYDREIDRAERSAIRRITEKDDVAQKLMVLCVAHIHDLSRNSYEIDLTDGWYKIRTKIDPALCQYVTNGKITSGTKLMIQNAELINCEDGCHPLQIPDHVRLKINLNSTRRAAWYLKLGYQKQCRPLPITIKSIQPEGGQIALVKVYINRVYPVRYLEHDNNSKVWRNSKSEEKRAEEFERDKLNRIETIQEKVIQDYASSKTKLNFTHLTNVELSLVKCPQQLHDYLESSKDPESFVERLSTSQRTSLMTYMQNTNLTKQQDILAKVAEEVSAQKSLQRNVTAVLRLLVTDAFDSAKTAVSFSIWRPKEYHFDILKEDCVVSMYNIVPNKMRNELSSTARTCFEIEERDCQKNNRQIVPIAMTIDSYYKPVYNEIDTVGLVVQTEIGRHEQELWLSDFHGRLLLVRVHDGPLYCSLLDNINRGDCIALMNLLVHKAQRGYGQCVANQLSVISAYPQMKIHRDSLEIFRQQLPKDLKQLLSDCDIKIEKYRLSAEICNKSGSLLSAKLVHHTSFDDYGDEEAFNSSGITAADMALSLMQIDTV